VANEVGETVWLVVIGKALAYLCVQEVSKNDPKRVGTLLDKVKFLEGIGVPKNDAALLLGSTVASVATLVSAKKKGAAGGKKRKK
jgi:hypothetical protein